MSSELSCAQRIADRLSSREEDFEKIFDAIDNDQEYEGQDAYDALHEYALGISNYEVVRIDLSTGGPADWLECIVNRNSLVRVDYHFADWFDHAEMLVSEDSALWSYAESIVGSILFS